MIGIALLGVRVLFHFLRLPVEFDASFRRALPMLETGRYLDAGDMPGARTVLRAAALTYVASFLVGLLNTAHFRRLLPFSNVHHERPVFYPDKLRSDHFFPGLIQPSCVCCAP